MNPRSCIVSRQRLPRHELIRFVAAPDGEVVPDLKEKLPGRGVWTEARKDVVAKAVQKRLFASGLKQQVVADARLPERVEELLDERARQALGLARKAGALVTGFAKVDTAIRSGEAVLVLHARDGAADGKRKLASAVRAVGHLGGIAPEEVECWSTAEMSAALGLENAVHAAALAGGASDLLIAAIRRLQAYRGDPDRLAGKG